MFHMMFKLPFMFHVKHVWIRSGVCAIFNVGASYNRDNIQTGIESTEHKTQNIKHGI